MQLKQIYPFESDVIHDVTTTSSNAEHAGNNEIPRWC